MRYFNVLLFLLPVLLVSCSRETSPKVMEESPIDVTNLRFSTSVSGDLSIYDDLQYEVIPKDSLPDNAVHLIKFQKGLPETWRKHRVSSDVIEKELLLKFTLVNNSDSTQYIYFYPGAYFERFHLLRLSNDGGAATAVPDSETPQEHRAAFRLLPMAPGERASYVARLEFVRTSATMFYPAVLQKEYVDSFLKDKIQFRSRTNMISYVVAGIMLMMIMYSIAVYRQNSIREFIYYIGYAGSLALMLFLKAFLLYDFTRFNYFFESYWDFLLQCGGVGCYFLFIRKFLNTKVNHPFIDKTFRIGQYLILGFLAIYSVLYFFTNNFVLLNTFENITKQMLFVIGVVFIVYGLTRKSDKLLRYVVYGNIWLLIFSVISFMLIVTPLRFVSDPTSEWRFMNNAIIYYEIALVGELMYFLSGLAHKNRRDIIEKTKETERLKLANEKKEIENQIAILEAQKEERNRISADMHDELGSGVTHIRLMSEIVKTKMKENASLPEIDKISNSANDLITKMNTIIWTMTSSNDSVENLITYIRTYALDFFENTHIECTCNIPPTIPNIQLSGEKRRNVFLAVKEALNNVLKHSKATNVTINIALDDKLYISIQDDGVGIDLEKLRRFGNGLKNMKSRLERINGNFIIQNNGGALTQFEMNL